MLRALTSTLLVSGSNLALAQAPDEGTEPMRVEGSLRWGTIEKLKEPYYPPSLTESRAKRVPAQGTQAALTCLR
jgi:hypothetical protein